VVVFGKALRTWAVISLQTFGGPAGQIAVMHRMLVDHKRWVGERRFLHALSFCTLLPGPEAQQLATYLGWLLNGVKGGLAAGVLFVLPGMAALLALSAIYVTAGQSPLVSAVFLGLASAVLAIVAQAVIRVGSRALGHPALVGLATAAFLALALLQAPFPLVVAGAAAIGWALGRWWPDTVHRGNQYGRAADVPGRGHPSPLVPDDALHHGRPSRARTLRVLLVGLACWAAPLLTVVAVTGRDSVFTDMGLFFSGAAVVTFGGAYAVLAYVAQQAVVSYGWLAPGEMLKGLALAETTPGPLIMVVQFVAFVGAYRSPAPLDPWVAAVTAALLVTWVTFVPSILFVLLGAPYVEALRGNQALSAALTGITAAVVGVIANLAVYFAAHTLFATLTPATWGPVAVQVPDPTSLRPVPAVIAAVAAVLLFGLRWPVLRVLAACAGLGLLAGLAGLIE
jgi:chromate transporter